MNELNKIYEALFGSWGGLVKANCQMVVKIEGEEHPITIDGMNLYMPLSEALDADGSDKVFFHPACENIMSKETEVFKIIRKLSVMRLLTDFVKYPAVLMKVADEKGASKSWRQAVMNLVGPIKDSKRATRTELASLFAHMEVELKEGVDNRFIHFKLTKGGSKVRETGQSVFYRAKAIFPFYSEMVRKLARSEGHPDNHQVDVNGISVSRACLQLAVHIFQSIIPMVNNPDDYEFVATDATAARLTAYLAAYAEVAEQMNTLQNTFRKMFDNSNIYPIDLSWTESIELLPELWNQIPVMDYNSHSSGKEDTQARRADVGSLLSVTSTTGGQGQQVIQPNMGQVATETVSAETIHHTPNGDFVTTVPQMMNGDIYQRTEVDGYNNRVTHYATNPHTGGTVVYRCSRQGNLIQREEPRPMYVSPQQQHMYMNPGQYNMMPMQPQPGQYVQYAQPQYQQAVQQHVQQQQMPQHTQVLGSTY